MLEFLVLPTLTVLNRLRGDDSWMRRASVNGEQAPQWLPGRALFYVSAGVFLTALCFLSWQMAGLFAMTYLLWGVFAWGRWFDLGRLPDDFAREGVRRDAFEMAIEMAGGGNDHGAFFMRQLMIMPGLIAIAWWTSQPIVAIFGPIFAWMVLTIYEFSWSRWPEKPIQMAEYGTGAAWGLLLLILMALPT